MADGRPITSPSAAPDPAQSRRRRGRRHRLVPQSALDPLLVPAARRPGLGLPPGRARRPARRHRPRARRKTSTTSTASCPWSSPSSPRAPALGAAQRELGEIDIESLPPRPRDDRPADRPPRDGDHGRQLQRDLLPRRARRDDQRALAAGRPARPRSVLDVRVPPGSPHPRHPSVAPPGRRAENRTYRQVFGPSTWGVARDAHEAWGSREEAWSSHALRDAVRHR